MVLKPVVQWKNPWLKRFGYAGLFPGSLLLGIILRIRYGWYFLTGGNARRFRTPVIAVGSLLTGGSGKTPLVKHLAINLTLRGFKIAVISHGYRKRGPGMVIVSNGQQLLADVYAAGDESFMLAEDFIKNGLSIPVVSSPRRTDAMRVLEATFQPDCVILDDGAQYRKLFKNCEILTRDYYGLTLPDWLLPVGRRRDLVLGRRDRDMHVITKVPTSAVHDMTIRYASSGLCFVSRYQPVHLCDWISGRAYALGHLSGRPLILFSALGMNDDFYHTMRGLAANHSATVERIQEYQDHHWYTERDIRNIIGAVPEERAENYLWITTPKDAVKIRPEWIPPELRGRFLSLYAEVVFDNENTYIESVMKITGLRSPSTL